MKLGTRLRVSSATWAVPVCLGLIYLYFFKSFKEDFKPPSGQPDYAPYVVSSVLLSFYAVSYAVASGLSAWEAGRLKRDQVWKLSPVRFRYRIALESLLPVVAVAWILILVPVCMALVQEGTAPDAGSLVLVLMALVISLAHCATGFCVGTITPPRLAPPILSVAVFYAVSAAWSYEPFWLRHLSGHYATDLLFGELPATSSVVAPVAFIWAIAAAAVLFCTPARNRRARPLLWTAAVSVLIAGTYGSYSAVKEWGHTPPLSYGNVASTCAGQKPRVCLPESEGDRAKEFRAESNAVFDGLAEAGIAVKAPGEIKDNASYRRHPRMSTEETWWLPLTEWQSRNAVRYNVLIEAIDLRCEGEVDQAAVTGSALWAAEAAGVFDYAWKVQERDLVKFREGKKILAEVEQRLRKVRKMPSGDQVRWYENEVQRSCIDR